MLLSFLRTFQREEINEAVSIWRHSSLHALEVKDVSACSVVINSLL